MNRRLGGAGIRRGIRQGGGSPAAFSPLDVAGLVCWFRGGDWTLSGSDVTQWTDLSGNGNHVAPSGTAPTAGTMAGLDAVHFAGASGSGLSLNPMPSFSNLHAFAICAADNDPPLTNNDAGFWHLGASAQAVYRPFSDGKIYEQTGISARYSFTKPAVDLTETSLYECSASSAGAFVFRTHGATFGSGTDTFGMASVLVIGRAQAGNPYYDGKMGEVLLYDAVLTGDDLANVRAYLADRWGVAT